jgi:hypothetical protein
MIRIGKWTPYVGRAASINYLNCRFGSLGDASWPPFKIHFLCLQALEQGLGGVILKVEDTEAVFQLKVICFMIGLVK